MATLLDEFPLGERTSVGELISLLFPKGFRGRDYLELFAHISYPDHDSRRDRLKSKLLDEYDNYEPKLIATIDKTLTHLAGKRDVDPAPVINGIHADYKHPPCTPFDLFAIAALLLQRSGAYHHIETNRVVLSDSIGKTRRIVLVTEKERQRWTSIGRQWSESNGRLFFVRKKSTKKGIPKRLLTIWCSLLLDWNSPVFDPRSATSDAPPWWRHALALLSIADVAATGTGFVRTQEDKKNASSGTAESFDEEAPEGLVPAPKESELQTGAEISSSGETVSYWNDFAYYLLQLDSYYVGTLRTGSQSKNIGVVFTERRDNASVHTLSIASRDFVSVLPKSRTAQIGCTLRSLSLNLALLPARGLVRANWAWQDFNYRSLPRIDRKPFNLVVIPAPYRISASCFKPVSYVRRDEAWGTFQFAPPDKSALCHCSNNLLELTKQIIAEAGCKVGDVHGLIFPELSLTAEDLDELLDYVEGYTNIELVCAGTREIYKPRENWRRDSTIPKTPSNEAIMAAFEHLTDEELGEKTPRKRPRSLCTHQKHHRWRLTSDQIVNYGLASALDPSMVWWEDLRVLSRRLPFMVMRDSWTVTTLICEDLARVDPAQEMVRAIGPNLTISLVMDGPQSEERWSARYATVLAEDPGSAVLTVNSLGLIERSSDVRSVEHGIHKKNRAVALWRDDRGKSTPLVLPDEHHAICVTIYEEKVTDYTLDNRSDDGTGISLRLGNYFPIKVDGDAFAYW